MNPSSLPQTNSFPMPQDSLSVALQGLFNVMQMEYQIQAAMYGLTNTRKARIDNVRDGANIFANTNLYVEVVPGFTDLNLAQLRNYQVFLKVKGSQNHISVPCEFRYEPYIKPGHAMGQIRIPSHQTIAELVRG